MRETSAVPPGIGLTQDPAPSGTRPVGTQPYQIPRPMNDAPARSSGFPVANPNPAGYSGPAGHVAARPPSN
jgi:hypothetical protein